MTWVFSMAMYVGTWKYSNCLHRHLYTAYIPSKRNVRLNRMWQPVFSESNNPFCFSSFLSWRVSFPIFLTLNRQTRAISICHFSLCSSSMLSFLSSKVKKFAFLNMVIVRFQISDQNSFCKNQTGLFWKKIVWRISKSVCYKICNP